MLKKSIYAILFLAFVAKVGFAQVSWQRTSAPAEPPLALFHSTHVISLPTAETLQKNDLQFEISHRFLPPLNETPAYGDPAENLYGLDGPVNMRIALGWAPTDDILLFGGRSNVDDNWDIYAKWNFLSVRNEMLPFKLAARAGVAFNTIDDATVEDGTQYWAQLIVNTMIAEKLGLGIIPSYLINASIRDPESQNTLSSALYVQYYVSETWNLVLEWNSILDGYKNKFNPLAAGIELETGGHFFKIFVTNSTRLNTTQYLVGSGSRDDWRLGFTITRLLKL